MSGPGTGVMIFKIISPKKSAKQIGAFDSKQSQIMQKSDHNLGF
jgi:hypothetical protein